MTNEEFITENLRVHEHIKTTNACGLPKRNKKFCLEVLLISCWKKTFMIDTVVEYTVYHKTSSRGAYIMDMIIFEVFLKSIDLIPQQQVLQRQYLYYK